MEYIYRFKNIDCPNCASKTETSIGKVAGVVSCRISFFSQKLFLQTESEMTLEFMEKILRAAKKSAPKLVLES